jgi:lipoprotein-anchoring transpeptidase ErfK/SrfK
MNGSVIMRWTVVAGIGLAALTGACVVSDDGDDVEQTTPAPATSPGPAPQAGAQQPAAELRLEVNLTTRQLTVFRGGQPAETHPVAVGSSEWPTPTGEWTIGQVVFNPRWVPPDEAWAEDESVKEPGDPENPLGHAQLVYSPPNSIHGTNEPESLGQAVSHGSIRVSNEVAVQLARQVMEAGGAQRDEGFFQRVQSNRTQREEVSIPNPVPIRVIGG